MSTDPLVIAIDTSTTATKAIIVDPTGAVLATGKADPADSQYGDLKAYAIAPVQAQPVLAAARGRPAPWR